MSEMSAAAHGHLLCPVCKSDLIRFSRRVGIFERFVLPLLHMRTYRCLDCNHRFYYRPKWQHASEHKPA
jgi:hypothetical protein